MLFGEYELMATLKKRGKNWYSYFKAGGKRINRSLGPDHAQARIALHRLVEKYQIRGSSDMSTDTSWEAFKTRFLAFRSIYADETIYRDKLAFETLEKSYPIRKLSDITIRLIEDWQGKLKETNSNVNTNRLIQSVKVALRKAEEWELIEPQKWKFIKELKEPKGRLIYWTPEECGNLLKRCHGVWRTIALLGIRSGLRRGEIYWLKWENVHFDTGMLHITGKPGWETKNRESRYIPMPPDLITHLKGLPKGPDFLVNHTDLNLDVVTNYFKKLVKKAGLKGSLHTARHTYASHLVQNGANLYRVMTLLGHSRIEMTQIYAHLSPQDLKDAVRLLPPLAATE